MFQCLTLNFLPTQPGLVIVVVVNNLAIDELPELPGHLRTSNLSILLIPKEWFEGEKGDWHFKITFPSFSLLAAKDNMSLLN